MIRADITRAQAALRQWEFERRCRCPEGREGEAAVSVLLALATALDHGAEFADDRVLYLTGHGSEGGEELHDRVAARRFLRRGDESRLDAERARQLARLIREKGMPGRRA